MRPESQSKVQEACSCLRHSLFPLSPGCGLSLESHTEQELGLDVLWGQEGGGTALQGLTEPGILMSLPSKASHPNPS